MTKFTQFKQGEYKIIEKYVSLIKKDFDIVEAFDDYKKSIKEVSDVPVEDSSDNFYDRLLDGGYIDYIDPDGVSKEQLEKDPYIWEMGLNFPSLQKFNTFHDLAPRLQEKLPIHDLIALAEAVDVVIPAKEDGIDLVVNDILKDINQLIEADAYGERDDKGIREFLFLLRSQKLRQKLDADIEKRGYTIMGVFDYEGGLSFVYTIGLSIKHGVELIVRAPVNTKVLSGIIHACAEKVIKDESMAEPFTYGARLATGELVRFKAIEVTRESTENFILSTRTEGFKTLQILVADGNNILPDEEGYDPEFKQPLFVKVD